MCGLTLAIESGVVVVFVAEALPGLGVDGALASSFDIHLALLSAGEQGGDFIVEFEKPFEPLGRKLTCFKRGANGAFSVATVFAIVEIAVAGDCRDVGEAIA